MTLVRQNLAAKFKDKVYRDAFVAEQIFSRLPLKIRCLREEQQLTQKELGDLAGIAQTWVSKLEDPNYGKLTISTLLKVASALDVGLKIDFVPYSTVLREAAYRTAGAFSVPKFEDDSGLTSIAVEYSEIANHAVGALAATGTENLIPFQRKATTAATGGPELGSAPLAARAQAV